MNENNTNKICGYKWDPLGLNDFMHFWGIMIYMATRPTLGQSYWFCWDDQSWHAYTMHMK